VYATVAVAIHPDEIVVRKTENNYSMKAYQFIELVTPSMQPNKPVAAPPRFASLTTRPLDLFASISDPAPPDLL
ncbi:hypothetical protein Tco_0476613, partial [Tanacetum coccineum]